MGRKSFGKFPAQRVKVVTTLRRNARHSVLATSSHVDQLEKCKKLLQQPTGFLPTDQQAAEDDKASSKLKVIVRARPLNEKERKTNPREVVAVAGPSMLVFDPPEDSQEFFFHNKKQKDITAKKYKNLKFAFDSVCDATVTNEAIYKRMISPLLSTLMTGVNCSVFAYGATGSGKTYTMLGTPECPGLTFLAMQDLYSRLDQASEQFESQLVVSYYEVYNEQVRDLLNYTGDPLPVREIGTGGIDIANLSYHRPQNVEDLMEMLRLGNSHRSQHATDHNAESSRSHALLQVQIQLRDRHSSMNTTSRCAKLVMVDLAGSEKGAATGCKGQRFREGSSINKSLLALGNCISALASGKKFIQYRESKLTRILKDSLGGNCKTVMVANVSPSAALYEDTLNTLRYAEKAKKISCTTKKNLMTVQSCLSQYTRVVDEMAAKINALEEEKWGRDELIKKLQEELDRAKMEAHMKEVEGKKEVEDKACQASEEGQGTVGRQILGVAREMGITVKYNEKPGLACDQAVHQFRKIVKNDLKAKEEIVKGVEEFFHKWEVTEKMYFRFQKMLEKTGDLRFERAAEKYKKKMNGLLWKFKLSLDKLEDMVAHSEVVAGKIEPVANFGNYLEMWKELQWTLEEYNGDRALIGDAKTFMRKEVGKTLRDAKEEELTFWNNLLKTQVDSLRQKGEKKDEMLADAVDLISKLHSLATHYKYDTAMINQQFESFIASMCGASVHFGGSDEQEPPEQEEEEEGNGDGNGVEGGGGNEGKPKTGEKFPANPIQFYNRTMARIRNGWNSQDPDSTAKFNRLLETHDGNVSGKLMAMCIFPHAVLGIDEDDDDEDDEEGEEEEEGMPPHQPQGGDVGMEEEEVEEEEEEEDDEEEEDEDETPEQKELKEQRRRAEILKSFEEMREELCEDRRNRNLKGIDEMEEISFEDVSSGDLEDLGYAPHPHLPPTFMTIDSQKLNRMTTPAEVVTQIVNDLGSNNGGGGGSGANLNMTVTMGEAEGEVATGTGSGAIMDGTFVLEELKGAEGEGAEENQDPEPIKQKQVSSNGSAGIQQLVGEGRKGKEIGGEAKTKEGSTKAAPLKRKTNDEEIGNVKSVKLAKNTPFPVKKRPQMVKLVKTQPLMKPTGSGSGAVKKVEARAGSSAGAGTTLVKKVGLNETVTIVGGKKPSPPPEGKK